MNGTLAIAVRLPTYERRSRTGTTFSRLNAVVISVTSFTVSCFTWTTALTGHLLTRVLVVTACPKVSLCHSQLYAASTEVQVLLTSRPPRQN